LTPTEGNELRRHARYWIRRFRTAEDSSGRSINDPEELVQEAKLRALDGRRKSWDGQRERFVPWLKGVIRSVAGERLPRRPKSLEGDDVEFLKARCESSTIRRFLFARERVTKEPRPFEVQFRITESRLRTLIS